MNSNYQYSPQRFQVLPPICKNLIIINVILYFAFYVLRNRGIIDLSYYMGLHIYASPLHHFWQYITYAFMHANFTHLLFNMFAFWMFGAVLENVWGAKRFMIFCLVAALGAALAQQITYYFMYHNLINEVFGISNSNKVHFITTGNQIMTKEAWLLQANQMINSINTVGASGIVFGVLLAFGMMFPNNYIYFYFLVPMKAKWFVIGYILLELFEGVFHSADGVAHFAHLGGALAGFILIMIWRKGSIRKFYH